MRLITTILILLQFMLASGQEFKYPEIKKNGETINDFILSGWKISSLDSTDFNKDSLMDYVVVLEKNNFITISDNNDCSGDAKYYPKILLILFKSNAGILFKSLQTNKIFGNCNWGIQGTDPFVKVGIRKKSFYITFETGGTERTTFNSYFSFRDNDWYLIGETTISWELPTTDFYIKDENFITKEVEEYRLINGKKMNKKKHRIENESLVKLSEYKN